MTITITFTNGDVVDYTNCTASSVSNGVLSFTGTNKDGVQVTVKINWATVQTVEEHAGS